MRKSLIYILIILLFSCSKNKKLYSLVNPFIGTGGHGHTYPGATAPFGFVQLSPDTRLEGWDGCGGYHYTDSIIYGFSHTHLSGTGVSDYGDVLFMPFTGQDFFDNGYKTSPDSGYSSYFSHANEAAEAGYYRVNLSTYGIDVELTATERVGFHHYTYPANERKKVILDLTHRDKLLDADITIIGNSVLSGKRISDAWAREQHIYYYAEFSEEFTHFEYNTDSTKIILWFDGDNRNLWLKVGLSAVDEAGAKLNLVTEIPHWDFQQIKSETQAKWNSELAKIEAETLSDDDKIIFYTAMYHSFVCPNIFSDVDGKYRGTDLKIHQAEKFQNYTVFSLWDTYRATHPLFTIIQQQRTVDFINTFLHHYENGGKLPMWELAGNYTGCMIGYHAVSVIADAYLKGINDFDAELALEAMIATSNANELGKPYFIKQGYMAADEEHESVSKNLEYAYNDWCIAQMAKKMGKTDIYEEYIKRAQHYKNIFDPKTDFMRAKRNQQFIEPFNPKEVNFNFTEANAWQYSFYVPQDVSGLIALHGGNANFEAKLDQLFSEEDKTTGRHQVDITGLIGQYAHGNEPSHHMAYLYNYISKPWKTQQRVRQIMDEMYNNSPDGLIGNEDCGQMSSWYVLSALGFYPVTPGSDMYVIGSPQVKNGKINLENGKTFEIKTKNQSKEHIYVRAITLNGKDYRKSFITHQDILNGGVLVFEMSDKPALNEQFEPPISQIDEHLITPVPFVKANSQSFYDSLVVSFDHVSEDAEVYYAINNGEFMLYSSPFVIRETTHFEAYATVEDAAKSYAVKASFNKVDKRRKVTYNRMYNPQYTAGGEYGLVDYIRGGNDFRTGAWQGFQGHDVEITVDLERVQTISSISSGYIQDINSWIWMPQTVTYTISVDGKQYNTIGTLKNTIPTDEYGAILHDFSIDFTPQKARYIKVTATQFGKIPDWHLGKGGESFIFIDEIIIK